MTPSAYAFLNGSMTRVVERMYLSFLVDPSTDAVITWHDKTLDNILEYREVGAQEWIAVQGENIKSFPGLDLRVHNAVLRNLTPARTYEVRVKLSGMLRKFRTLSPSAAIKIAVASDIHWSDAFNTGSHHKQVSAHMIGSEPDIVLSLGDFLGGDGVVSESTANYMAAFCDELSNEYFHSDGTMIPFVTTLGNHDCYGGGAGGSFLTQPGQGAIAFLDKLFFPLWRAGDNCPTGKGYGWFSVGTRLLVIAIDSQHSTYLSEQRDWFAQTLADKADNFDHVLCVSHLSPIYQTSIRGDFLRVAQNYPNVKVWVNGHEHVQYAVGPLKVSATNGLQSDSEGVHIYGAGGWGNPSQPINTARELVYFSSGNNAYYGSITNPIEPNGTTRDPATQGFWLLNYETASNVTATCININGQPYYTNNIV